MKPTILFDLDGTLIDSTDAIVESFYTVFKELNYEKPKYEDILPLIGQTLKDMFVSLGIKENHIQESIKKYKTFYRSIQQEKTTLLPQAKDAISLASSFANIGIVTTKMSTYLPSLLDYLTIGHFFNPKYIIGFNDVKNPKPHQEPILLAINRIKADINNTWMIGDTIMDTLSAKNANIKSIGVLCGYSKEDILKQDASFICNNSFDAIKLIQKQYIK
jgi:phosphoglycolate phosphatase